MLRFALVILLAAACGPGPTPTPSPQSPSPPTPSPALTASPEGPSASAGAVAGLLAELSAEGGEVGAGERFDAMPLAGEGVLVCLDGEPLRLYVFPSADEAAARGAMIDPRDPTNVGTAIIEWTGNPKFWLYDRLLVLYLGSDSDVTAMLVDVLGEPFAFGQGRPPLRGDDPC